MAILARAVVPFPSESQRADMIVDPRTGQPVDLSQGIFIPGFDIDEHTFMGRVTGQQFNKLVLNPQMPERQPKILELSEEYAEVDKVHRAVQRLFEGQKKKNVEPYAQYICAVTKAERNGITPPPILFTTQQLDVVGGYLIVPWGTPLVAIDGETQTAARHLAARLEKSTLGVNIGIVLCHGRSIEWARQCFHDLNTLGIKPNAAIAISMDAYDPATNLARRVEQAVPFLRGKINQTRRQLRKNDKEVLTLPQLRTAVVTFAVGIAGVQFGSKPVDRELDVDRLEPLAVRWFQLVGKVMGKAIEQRSKTVAAAPSILAAVGAMGNAALASAEAFSAYGGARTPEDVLEHQAQKLAGVRWERGDHWLGICGKTTRSGGFSIAGSKEAGYASYEALNDTASKAYRKVRRH
jgi:DndB-like DNA-sulfur modification-associated protein